MVTNLPSFVVKVWEEGDALEVALCFIKDETFYIVVNIYVDTSGKHLEQDIHKHFWKLTCKQSLTTKLIFKWNLNTSSL